ncbi:MAG: UDP-N-acetylglucosamine--N-acetylmuramyl-(pentapeptide) pyrophosphoryl-undecaprenol N-acetylglucosamine transferase [Chloroflexi bacterium]|nr:UDP-N-acetylglucosamine--N-acetylmuramyl-(pentapeptide) pyrophosphoryl-undecaprenol N-acetylglucosamine transferase [Chloroflexota bacterium]
MRVLISGGGTGGHVYPALSVAERLIAGHKSAGPASTPGEDTRERRGYAGGKFTAPPATAPTTGVSSPSILWIGGAVGTGGGVETELVQRAGLEFAAIPAGQVRGMHPLRLAGNMLRLVSGFAQAINLVKRFHPDVMLTTGGYVSVPVVLACWVRRVPSVVYLPDLEPGWAVRFAARFASRIAVSFPEVEHYFPAHKVVTTGYPVRRSFVKKDPAQARKILGLDPKILTVLVFGGSRGAHNINKAFGGILPELIKSCQVIHVTGAEDYDAMCRMRDALPASQKPRYSVYSYLHHEMADAMSASDLVVARAGAAILGEFPIMGIPSILIPYPFAGAHQKVNADFMAKHGAAVILDDAGLDQATLAKRSDAGTLLPLMLHLLHNEAARQQMAVQANRLSRPDAADHLAQLLQEVAQGGRRQNGRRQNGRHPFPAPSLLGSNRGER